MTGTENALLGVMSNAAILTAVRTKYELLLPLLTERLRRQWAACEAQTLGRGGVRTVAQATGLSRTTIWAGLKELRRRAERPQDEVPPERIRAPGGGRPALGDADPTLVRDLEALVELDVQEYAQAGRGAAPPRACREPP